MATHAIARLFKGFSLALFNDSSYFVSFFHTRSSNATVMYHLSLPHTFTATLMEIVLMDVTYIHGRNLPLVPKKALFRVQQLFEVL